MHNGKKPPMMDKKGMSNVKAKDFKGTLKKLINYIKEYRVLLLVVVIFTVFSTVLAIIGPNILGDVTTEIFNGLIKKISGTGNIDFKFINKTLKLLLGLYIFSSACTF